MRPKCSLMFVAILQEKENLKIPLLLLLSVSIVLAHGRFNIFLKSSSPPWFSFRYFIQKLNSDWRKKLWKNRMCFRNVCTPPDEVGFETMISTVLFIEAATSSYFPSDIFLIEGAAWPNSLFIDSILFSSREKIVTRCESIEFDCTSWELTNAYFCKFQFGNYTDEAAAAKAS